MRESLLDTNVVSELVRAEPQPQVVAYLKSLADGYLSVVTIHELVQGAQRLSDEVRRQRLTEWVRTIEEQFADHILPITHTIAHQAAMLRAREARTGRTVHLADTLIAATALHHDLPLATRNTTDFEQLGIDLHNPWLDS